MILGGAVAGQGAIDDLPADRDRLVLRLAPATRPASSSAAGSAASSCSATARGSGSRHERFEQVEDYFARHGGKTILIGRFIGLVRASRRSSPAAPGCATAPSSPTASSAPGSGRRAAHPARLLLLAEHRHRRPSTPARAPSCSAIADRRRSSAHRRRRPLPARAGEPRSGGALDGAARRDAAGWSRSAPLRRSSASSGTGSRRAAPSGSSSHSLMAALAVGLFVLVAYTVIVGGDPGPTPGDATAIELVDQPADRRG